jgi:hypothetical protein
LKSSASASIWISNHSPILFITHVPAVPKEKQKNLQNLNWTIGSESRQEKREWADFGLAKKK